MDIDLVPCFRFTEEHWPQGFKKSTSQQVRFKIVHQLKQLITLKYFCRRVSLLFQNLCQIALNLIIGDFPSKNRKGNLSITRAGSNQHLGY